MGPYSRTRFSASTKVIVLVTLLVPGREPAVQLVTDEGSSNRAQLVALCFGEDSPQGNPKPRPPR
jgi:hypothetical protein